MTKQEARKRQADWSKALQESRVVRFNGGLSLNSYPTVERAQAALQEALAAGFEAEIAPTITKTYIRTYTDNGQTTAYVEWSNGSRTEGPENGAHMRALLQRAQRLGLPLIRETW